MKFIAAVTIAFLVSCTHAANENTNHVRSVRHLRANQVAQLRTRDHQSQQPQRRSLVNSGGITFRATNNTDLVPTKIDKSRVIEDSDSMLRSTNAFKNAWKTEEDLYSDEESSGPDIRLIRGTGPETRKNNSKRKTLSTSNGLITAALDAYNNHLNLELRPDDIWIAILTQFSAYVNGQGRAEKLRGRFVDFDGKEEISVTTGGSIETFDIAGVTMSLLDGLTEKIKDPSLRDWFLPGFSTSTRNDEVCAAASALCTMQEYFTFSVTLTCGIPEVTLLGTVEDWEGLRKKVDGLVPFAYADDDESLSDGDEDFLMWIGLLRKVCDNFVESAQNGSANNLEFWDKIVSEMQGGSGADYISGWITTFSFYDFEGMPMGTLDPPPALMVLPFDPEPQPQAQEPEEEAEHEWLHIGSGSLTTANVVSCPIEINDNGEQLKSRLFVGKMAVDSTKLKKRDRTAEAVMESERKLLRVIQPRNDWALAIEEPTR